MNIKEAIEYLECMQKDKVFEKTGYVYGNEAIKTVLEVLEYKIEEDK